MARSMNGLNDIEVNEITFEDGSTLTSTEEVAFINKNNNYTALNSYSILPFKTGTGTDLNPINAGDMATKHFVEAQTDNNDYITAFTHDATNGNIVLTQADTGTPVGTTTLTGATITTAERNNLNECFDAVDINGNDLTFSRVDDANPKTINLPQNTNDYITAFTHDATNGNIVLTQADTGTPVGTTTLTGATITTAERNNLTNAVLKTTAQSIGGVKTFTSFPVKSGTTLSDLTPTTDGQLTPKKYLDHKLGEIDAIIDEIRDNVYDDAEITSVNNVNTLILSRPDGDGSGDTSLILPQTDLTDVSSAIATNATNIATNTTDIATNSTNIATNTTDIATNSTNIATNTTAIGTNTTAISNLVTATNSSFDTASYTAPILKLTNITGTEEDITIDGFGDVLLNGANAFTSTNTFNTHRPTSTLTNSISSNMFITKDDAENRLNNITANGNITCSRTGATNAVLKVEAIGLNYDADLDLVAVSRANAVGFTGGYNKIRSDGGDDFGSLKFQRYSNTGAFLKDTMRIRDTGVNITDDLSVSGKILTTGRVTNNTISSPTIPYSVDMFGPARFKGVATMTTYNVAEIELYGNTGGTPNVLRLMGNQGSYLQFDNGGHHIDSYTALSEAGRRLYINHYANQGVYLNRAYYSSDDRIKEEEKFIENATDTLLKLRPQTYIKYASIPDGSSIKPNFDLSGNFESGLIAQEIYYDAPELRHIVEVETDKGDIIIPSSDDPQKDPDYSDWGDMPAGVDYIQLIPYLIKSNQELHERILKLEAKKNIM